MSKQKNNYISISNISFLLSWLNQKNTKFAKNCFMLYSKAINCLFTISISFCFHTISFRLNKAKSCDAIKIRMKSCNTKTGTGTKTKILRRKLRCSCYCQSVQLFKLSRSLAHGMELTIIFKKFYRRTNFSYLSIVHD